MTSRLIRRPGQSTLRIGLAAVAGVFAMTFLGTGQRVAAECDGPFPPFREVVRTAHTIVIGDVVAVDRGGFWDPADAGGISSRFTLKILFVVRGASDAVVQVVDMPTQPCASLIGVRLGDRIALAVDGLAFTPPMRSNMVAWIDGPVPPLFGEADTYTVGEVFAMTGQQVPQPPGAEETPSPWPLVLGAGLVAVTLLIVVIAFVGRRSRQEDGSGPT